ncbi:MAG: hypothetical protein J7K49_04665 [Thaumarchaeota archaeon]|nr:hypothetical protein [Nitrososphaerota archaeon]
MGDEYGSLRKKFEELEEEVKKLKEPLETTLMDVRELISNLENPFNYATNILNVEELKKQSEDVEKGFEQKAEEDLVRGESEPIPRKQPIALLPEDIGGKSLATITCAYLLLKLLGKEYAVGFLNSRAARKFAPPRVLESLTDAIELILSLDGLDRFNIARVGKPDEEFTVAAAYLLNLLSSGADEKFFIILILLLKILDQKFGKESAGCMRHAD